MIESDFERRLGYLHEPALGGVTYLQHLTAFVCLISITVLGNGCPSVQLPATQRSFAAFSFYVYFRFDRDDSHFSSIVT